ncbi:MAG TPA: chloride channel protein [Bacteroidales bacterium]|nr:chloride channel protein [Bacteroidales bacterium]
MKKGKKIVDRFMVWRIRHISDRNLLMLLSMFCGFVSGVFAVFIKNFVYFIESLKFIEESNGIIHYELFFYPVIGIFLAILFKKYIVKKDLRYGIPGVLSAISRQSGYIPPQNIYAPAIATSVTLGFGGSVGMEGPAVNTGGAIGSNIGRWMGLQYKQIVLLIACGSAASIAGLFKAPVTGVVFALEVLMIDLSMASLVPLLIASVTGTLTSYFFLGQNVIYHISALDPMDFSNLPYYAVLGIFCGFISVYFTRVLMFFNKYFNRVKNIYVRMLVCGVLLGGLVLLLPALYGEGYHQINLCLKGQTQFVFDNSFFGSFSNSMGAVIIILAAIIVFKVIATSLTFSAGGVGGIFGPTLFLGAVTGLLFTLVVSYLNIGNIPATKFALAGMTGILTGVMHAPLTGIFLIAEITDGYHMIVPLIITASISYLTIKSFIPYSVDAIELAEKGELITHDKDKTVLNLMKIDKLIETNFITVSPDDYLGQLVKVIARSERNIFPVVDHDNNLMGIIFLNDIRDIIFNQSLYGKLFVHNLMFMPSPIVDPDESMEEVAMKFEKTDNYNLPVVKNGKYIGFVSRANFFSQYRQMIKQFSEE